LALAAPSASPGDGGSPALALSRLASEVGGLDRLRHAADGSLLSLLSRKEAGAAVAPPLRKKSISRHREWARTLCLTPLPQQQVARAEPAAVSAPHHPQLLHFIAAAQHHAVAALQAVCLNEAELAAQDLREAAMCLMRERMQRKAVLEAEPPAAAAAAGAGALGLLLQLGGGGGGGGAALGSHAAFADHMLYPDLQKLADHADFLLLTALQLVRCIAGDRSRHGQEFQVLAALRALYEEMGRATPAANAHRRLAELVREHPGDFGPEAAAVVAAAAPAADDRGKEGAGLAGPMPPGQPAAPASRAT